MSDIKLLDDVYNVTIHDIRWVFGYGPDSSKDYRNLSIKIWEHIVPKVNNCAGVMTFCPEFVTHVFQIWCEIRYNIYNDFLNCSSVF